MNLQTIHKAILTNSGASYSLKYGDLSGRNLWAYSIHKDREVKIPVSDFGPQDVKNYVLENSDLLSNDRYFLGAWIENGHVYLDVSKGDKSKQRAIKEAKANGQLAIFNLSTFETLNIQ